MVCISLLYKIWDCTAVQDPHDLTASAGCVFITKAGKGQCVPAEEMRGLAAALPLQAARHRDSAAQGQRGTGTALRPTALRPTVLPFIYTPQSIHTSILTTEVASIVSGTKNISIP